MRITHEQSTWRTRDIDLGKVHDDTWGKTKDISGWRYTEGQGW